MNYDVIKRRAAVVEAIVQGVLHATKVGGTTGGKKSVALQGGGGGGGVGKRVVKGVYQNGSEAKRGGG